MIESTAAYRVPPNTFSPRLFRFTCYTLIINDYTADVGECGMVDDVCLYRNAIGTPGSSECSIGSIGSRARYIYCDCDAPIYHVIPAVLDWELLPVPTPTNSNTMNTAHTEQHTWWALS